MGVISAGTRVIEWESGKNEWMFRVSAKDRWVAPFLVDHALQRSKTKKIGFMFEATGWGQGAVPDIEAATKAKGVALVGKETFNIGDQDMSAQLIRLRDAGADTLMFYTVDRETDAILRSMDRIGYKPTIVSAWGIGVQLGKTAGALTEGVLVHGTFAWTGQLSPARPEGVGAHQDQEQAAASRASWCCRAAPPTPMTRSTSSPRRSRSPAPTTRPSCATPCTR